MRLARTPPTRSLFLAVGLVAAAMIALACVRWSVWSYGTDTGTFAQAVANTGHGFADNLEGGSHFRFHWSPILALLWPLVAVTHSPLALQIAQVVLIALAAVPLYAIVAEHAGEAWALRCGVLALIYPPILANAFSEFHELAFYPVLVLTAVWAANRARWAVFAACSILLVLIREDACLDLAIAGLVLFVIGLLRRTSAERGLLLGEPRAPLRLAASGFGLLALSVGALAAYGFVVLPRAGAWAPSHFYSYPFAHGPLQTALAVFTHPVELTRAVATFGRLTYLLEAFVPLAFLPLLTRWTWLAFPGFAGILLASDQSVWRMGMHYVLLWAPWMVLAAAWALVRLRTRRSERAALNWWRTAVALCIVFLIFFNPMHPAHYLTREPYQHSTEAARAFDCVPHDAPVATLDEWYAHEALSHPGATVFGNDPQHFRGYLVYASDWQNSHFRQVLPSIEKAAERGRFIPVCRFGSVVVLRSNGS